MIYTIQYTTCRREKAREYTGAIRCLYHSRASWAITRQSVYMASVLRRCYQLVRWDCVLQRRMHLVGMYISSEREKKEKERERKDLNSRQHFCKPVCMRTQNFGTVTEGRIRVCLPPLFFHFHFFFSLLWAPIIHWSESEKYETKPSYAWPWTSGQTNLGHILQLLHVILPQCIVDFQNNLGQNMVCYIHTYLHTYIHTGGAPRPYGELVTYIWPHLPASWERTWVREMDTSLRIGIISPLTLKIHTWLWNASKVPYIIIRSYKKISIHKHKHKHIGPRKEKKKDLGDSGIQNLQSVSGSFVQSFFLALQYEQRSDIIFINPKPWPRGHLTFWKEYHNWYRVTDGEMQHINKRF